MLQYTDSPMDPPYIWYNFFSFLFPDRSSYSAFRCTMHRMVPGDLWRRSTKRARGGCDSHWCRSYECNSSSTASLIIILPSLNKLPVTACHYLNMCQHRENTPFFRSWPFFLPETLSMLQAYYYRKLQGVNREGSFFLRVFGGRPSACELI